MKKYIETIKTRTVRNNAISEITITLEGINSRLDEVENQISVLEVKVENHT